MGSVRDVRAAMAEVLGDRALDRETLFGIVAEDRSLGRPIAVREACLHVLQRSPSFGEVGRRVFSIPAIVEGTTWVVQVDADVAADGMLRMHPELAALGWWLIDQGADLVDPDGQVIGRIEIEGVMLDDVDTDVLLGPEGWLDAVAGGWAAVSIHRGSLRVEPIDAPPAPTQRQIETLRAGFDAAASDVDAVLFDGERRVLRSANGDAPFHAALLADRGAFTDGPPAYIPDLLAAAGLEQRTRTIAAIGFDWEALETWRRRNRMRTFYGLDDRGIDALTMVAGACGVFADIGADALGPEGDHENAAILLSALLEERGVAEAFWLETEARGGTVADIDAFTAELADLMEGVTLGGLGWVRARCRRELGDERAAVELFDELVTGGSDHAAVLVEAAATASDRGLALPALELLHRAGIHEDELDDEMFESTDPTIELALTVLREVLPYARHRPRPAAGRNDPCPCGSGKKYKACHLGKEQHPLDDRSGWLHQKLMRYARTTEAELIEEVAYDLAGASIVARRDVADLPFVTDLVLHDHDVVAEFLEDRGWLLPEDEQLLVSQWALVDRGVFEILDDRHDELRLRNLCDGEVITVVNAHGSDSTRPGSLLVGRPLPVGDTYRAFTGFLPVPPGRVDDYVAAVVDHDLDRLIDLLAGLFTPPVMRNTSGEDMWFHTITWDVRGCGPAEAIGAALVEAGLRDVGEHEWSLSEDTSGMRDASVAQLRLDVSQMHLVAEANSDERADRIIDVVASALDEARLIDEVRRSLDEVREDAALRGDGDDDADDGTASIDPNSPELLEFIEQTIRQKEMEWLDEHVPALGGRTPREAAGDPVGREQLQRLLSSFPEPGPGEFSFSPARLAATLGLP